MAQQVGRPTPRLAADTTSGHTLQQKRQVCYEACSFRYTATAGMNGTGMNANCLRMSATFVSWADVLSTLTCCMCGGQRAGTT
jgi:hypothetical protein